MFPLGHIGLTLALVVGIRRWVDVRLDYRILIVAALLPDFIDKPLGIALGIDGRNITHTLVFALALTALFLLFRWRSQKGAAGTWAMVLLALAIGTWTHLLFDRMGTLPEILLWPFLGLAFPPGVFDPLELLAGYRDPYILIGDLLGTAVIVYLTWRHGLHRKGNFRLFLRNGRLERRARLSLAEPE
ncbi:MAG: metal-dependent hydrolase [Thermoplasmata archaeon]